MEQIAVDLPSAGFVVIVCFLILTWRFLFWLVWELGLMEAAAEVVVVFAAFEEYLHSLLLQ